MAERQPSKLHVASSNLVSRSIPLSGARFGPSRVVHRRQMALAAPVLEQTYRYPFASALVGGGERRRLRLATSGGPAPNPEFFRGTLLLPVVASDLLLTVGDVARARFHVPPQMLARILLLADPVATCADDRLRFEAFSACCSVYGRVDLLPDGFDGEIVGRGTTNVDMGPDLRARWPSVQERSELGLAVGSSAVEVVADGTSAVERRVPLPSRWIRGFLEVQAIQADLAPVAELDGPGLRAFFRSIPKSPPKGPVWLVPSGRGLRLSHHDPGRGRRPWRASCACGSSNGPSATRRRCACLRSAAMAAPAGSSTCRAAV